MTLVQLEYIVAVDLYRSFVLAAEKCFVTQPTLSMQIQKLEETLGAKLFDRSRQPVTPTEIGIQIIEQAKNILAESAKLKELISIQKGEIKGELKVGIIPTIAPYLLPKLIPVFTNKYPELKLQVWELTTEQIVQQLKTGLLNCGVLSTPLEESSLSETPLFYENFVAYLCKGSPHLKKKSIVAEDIDPAELWLLNEGHCMRNQVMNMCNLKRTVNEERNFEYNTGSIETLKRMVDLNQGITILPELSLADFSSRQLDRVRYFKNPEPVREISIITHRNFLKQSAIKAFQDEILSIIPKQMRSTKKKEVMEIYR
ncbi:LysR family transcriptional regulator [Pedobacter sp. HMF7647]|uniref:LysR family transcriptional regulator n=1 Tax=Hufsiella arboris TaxID=2695275 RepID=A0A7K1Y5Y9_9SPHI|nr:hydrogen peroxide-inducible genes activator [Hufsiella arboris]MXV49996.1 LysR family transcriptional regulator [Hufsiella arboris]